MSEHDVEIVRTAIEAQAAGDVERALALLDPEIEWHGASGGLEQARVARGHQEVVRDFADYLATWERLEFEAERYIDAGAVVVVYFHELAKGRESGAVVETDTTVLFTVRDDRIVHVRSFLDRDEGLAAAGLDPAEL